MLLQISGIYYGSMHLFHGISNIVGKMIESVIWIVLFREICLELIIIYKSSIFYNSYYRNMCIE